ncbi:MAG TPA: PASTA domain-containing protein [Solirubrobacterales bacterium]|nr:PASTA domain-containing protein [Solirubrobacterales bacterium]
MLVAENTLVDGRYRLLRRVGSGGMADVWCAEDTQLGRRVALKMLHERFAQDREFVERFRREASSAAGLQHPNVVGVFDRGEFDGTYYIAMEYVEGSSLKDLIRRGMSVEEAVEVTRQVLAAARFAHSNGIIHRDLKPQNVLVDRDGRARVTDFGIARAGASEITQAGSVMGTAQYLSPEQAQGLPVTAASDLYSIGVLLYEALCGRVPFEGDSAVAVALKQVSEQPLPPSRINPSVPPALDAVVLKALAKDPANRFASADEFAAALDAAQVDPTTSPVRDTERFAPVPPPPPPEQPYEEGRRGWRWAILAILVLALAGLAVWALTRPADVTVPSVLGEQQNTATQILEAKGFDVDVEEFESDAPPGEVVEQDPRAGEEAEEGSTVTLSVSSGLGAAKVPDVAGQTERRATKALEGRGFVVETEEQFSTEVEAGLAIGTEPKAGSKLEGGSKVTLLVSKGANTVEVPGVVGLQQQIAENQLEAVDLIPNVETENSDQPEGTVVAQDPAAGSEIESGSQVTILVSTGAGSVIVPDVEGLFRDGAVRILTNHGLDVVFQEESVADPDDDGRVIDQAPAAGTRVRQGDTVSLVIGAFEEPSAEPQPVP